MTEKADQHQDTTAKHDLSREDIERVFGAPDLITGSGKEWYILKNRDQANLATRLSQTGIELFWSFHQERDDNHTWMVMVDHAPGFPPYAPVAICAVPEGQTSVSVLLNDCHVTGFQNQDAFFEHEADIRDACAALGLVCFPNHMGRRLEEPDDSPSP